MKNLNDKFCKDIEASNIHASQMVANLFNIDKDFSNEIRAALYRFQHCDWGNLEQDDIDNNNLHLHELSYSTLGAYTTKYGTICIKTEMNREITLILFPTDY